MERKSHPIVSVQIHPELLEHIDCYSKEHYSTRSETIRKILLKWCQDKKNQIEEPPIFTCSW